MRRIDRFGDTGPGRQLDPLLALLVVIVLVALLLPVARASSARRSGPAARTATGASPRCG